MQAGIVYVFILIFAIVLIILIVIMGYKALYKRKANQALDGVHSTSLIDPLSFFQVIVMIVTLILAVVAISRIDVLSSNLVEQTNRINQLNNDIDYLRSNVSSLEELLNQYIMSNQLVQDSSYEFDEYDELSNTLDTTISFVLKEIDADTTVYLVATNVSDASDYIKIEITSESLTFMGTMPLNIEKNYQITFVIESNSQITGGILFEIDIPTLLEYKMDFSAGVFGLNQTNFDFNFNYSYYGIDNLTIESITLRYYYSGNMIHSTVNLTSMIQDLDFSNKYELNYDSMITDMEITGFDVVVIDSWGNNWTSAKIPLGPNGSE